MDEAVGDAQERVKYLSDLELAALTCLIAGEHCIIATDDDLLTDVEKELRLIASSTFGLTCRVISCSEQTSLDDFGNDVLLSRRTIDHTRTSQDAGNDGEPKPREPGVISGLVGSHKPDPLSQTAGDDDVIAEVIIAKDLDRTSHQVQIQALELLRGRRIFSRAEYYTAPKKFLFIALLSAAGAPNLVGHLNDHFFISHYHSAEDGFPNLEDYHGDGLLDDKASGSSAPRLDALFDHVYGGGKYRAESLFSKDDVEGLTQLSEAVKLSAEVRTYLHNIITFMRLHRAVAGGVSSQATRHFHQLVRTLAPLHGIDFVTPSLVALAARKIYPHRILLVRPENERSLQWGSSLEAVREALEGVTVDDVIDDILEEVEVPV